MRCSSSHDPRPDERPDSGGCVRGWLSPGAPPPHAPREHRPSEGRRGDARVGRTGGCNRNVMSVAQAPRRTMLTAVRTQASPILVVDDDAKIVQLVQTYLEREGFAVITAADGPTALAALRDRRPRLVVLDIMLPMLDGLAITRIVRAESDVPILMLSARGAPADRLLGTNEGADDYVAKPFSPAELVGRVKAILRRSERPEERRHDQPVPFRDLMIDPARHEIRRGEALLDLTSSELRLLLALIDADGR